MTAPRRGAPVEGAPLALCFVCLGNICRSPTAEGVMRHLVTEAGLGERIHVASAGTADYHVGELPDPRTRAAARRRGIELSSRGRQFVPADFARFSLVLAMDRANLAALHRLAPDAGARQRAALLRSFEPGAPATAEVPDPYYGGEAGFEEVLDLCFAACGGLLRRLAADHDL